MPQKQKSARYPLVAELVRMGYGKDAKHLEAYAEQVALAAGPISEREASRFCFEPSAKQRARHRRRAADLLRLPQAPQGTEAWFAFRRGKPGPDGVMVGGHLTASDTGTILGLNPYGCAEEVLVNKCGDDTFDWSPACQHGTCYEEVSLAIFQARTGKVVREYGCIPGKGREAASPDGITECGEAVEIKNPFRRRITGVPKPVYHAQMQQQLEVLDLEKCHFIETSILEYSDAEAFAADAPADDPEGPYTAGGMEKGVVLEVQTHAGPGGRPKFRCVYAPITLGPTAAAAWVRAEVRRLEAEGLGEDETITVKHWRCAVYSCVPVLRDRAWWAAKLPVIEEFWARVEAARRDPQRLERAREAYRAFKAKKEARFGGGGRSKARGGKSRTRRVVLGSSPPKSRAAPASPQERANQMDLLFGPED